MTSTPLTPFEVLSHLRQCPQGQSLGELITHFGDAPQVCSALESAVVAKEVAFQFDKSRQKSGEVFIAQAPSSSFLTPGSERYELLNEVISLVRNQIDSRGDENLSITLQALHAALGANHSEGALNQAIRDGIEEELFLMRAQPISQYVCFHMAPVTRFTVLAYAEDGNQALCLHVRAGNAAVAVSKVLSAHVRGSLNILGVSSNTVRFNSVPGHSGFFVDSL